MELLVTFPSPHFETLADPCTPKMLRARERVPVPYPFVVFSLDSHLNLSRSLGVRKKNLILQ